MPRTDEELKLNAGEEEVAKRRCCAWGVEGGGAANAARFRFKFFIEGLNMVEETIIIILQGIKR